MTESDKLRAREVMEAGVRARTEGALIDVIAEALHAERERAAGVCEADAQTHDECADALLARPSYEWTPQQRDAYETHREHSQAARNFAARIRAANHTTGETR